MTALPPKPVATSAINSHVYKVFPNDLNANQTVFGGMVMAKCDRLSLVVAERHSGRVCVTAAVDSLHFRAPAKGNDTLIFRVAINRSWHSSMEIGVRVVAENSYTGEERHVVSAYFTFVALDEDGNTANVAEVKPESDAEKRRFRDANIRRESRLQMRENLKRSREGSSHAE